MSRQSLKFSNAFSQTLIWILMMLPATRIHAQQETFDLAGYTPPKGWSVNRHQDYVTYTIQQSGQWAQLAIYRSTKSTGIPEQDLQQEWEALVLAQHAVTNNQAGATDTMQGWKLASRSGNWVFNKTTVASMLFTFSNGTRCFSILCNTTSQDYFTNLVELIGSLKLPPVEMPLPQTPPATGSPNTATNQGNGPSNSQASNKNATGDSETEPVHDITGRLWVSYDVETVYSGGSTSRLTGGFFRSEYKFNADGTYIYRAHDFSVFVKEVRYVYESGTWSVSGSTLTIVPQKGKGQWFSKPENGRTDTYGSKARTYTHPLEKISYSFRLQYLSGMRNTYLKLVVPKAPARETRQSQYKEFSYSLRDTDRSLIIDPPGSK